MLMEIHEFSEHPSQTSCRGEQVSGIVHHDQER